MMSANPSPWILGLKCEEISVVPLKGALEKIQTIEDMRSKAKNHVPKLPAHISFKSL